MNLLDYEIINNCFRITRQWKVVRGSGVIGKIDGVNIRSDSYPDLHKKNIFLQGHEGLEDNILVPINGYPDLITKTLKTLSEIPIQTLETESGSFEYIEIPYNEYLSSQIVILGLEQIGTCAIRDLSRTLQDWSEWNSQHIKFEAKHLHHIQKLLNKHTIETLFYKEPQVVL